MDNDIVPSLLESIEQEFDAKTLDNNKLKKALRAMQDKKATYLDVNDFAIEIGQILADVLGNQINGDVLPDGKMYYNIAERILNATLKKNHDLVASFAVDVQTELNHQANLKLKGQRPELNQDRIDGMVNRLASENSFDSIKWIIEEPIINFTQSIVDDAIKKNAEFHAKSGLSPKITRRVSGHACKWCRNLAGTYDYYDAPKNVYQRHERCRCTVDYNPGDGRRQDVWYKTWKDPDKSDKIEARKDIGLDDTPEVIKRYARGSATAYDVARELGYIPLAANKVVPIIRMESKNWIESLNEFERISIEKYTYNGIDSDGMKLYKKINLYLTNKYQPKNDTEEKMLIKHINNIIKGIDKNTLNNDLIVYRKDMLPQSLEGNVNKFLSTSITEKGSLGNEPNVTIIVPKGASAAYVELLSPYPKQRELLLSPKTELKLLANKQDNYLYEVITNGR